LRIAPDLFFGRYTHHAALTEIFVSDAVTITNPRGLLHQGGTALREFTSTTNGFFRRHRPAGARLAKDRE
jgi:hypothetical protein